jgi:adenosylcobinamide hydrolase
VEPVLRRRAGYPLLVWRFPVPLHAIASGPLGGGLGERHWIINATVDSAYARLDPDVHLQELATAEKLSGPGVGMLTAVDVSRAVSAAEDGVRVLATVGLGHPTWAAAPDDDRRDGTGTINIVAFLPVPLSDAALVNAVTTVAEAKAQALWDCGVAATGTATDAVFVSCPARTGAVEVFAGPRSVWGARLARAAHSAVCDGFRDGAQRSSRL